MNTAPKFDSLDEAAEFVKLKCKAAPVCCSVEGSLYQVWGDGYAEYVGEDDPPEHPECSGDPADCPENEGHGCCKPNAPAEQGG